MKTRGRKKLGGRRFENKRGGLEKKLERSRLSARADEEGKQRVGLRTMKDFKTEGTRRGDEIEKNVESRITGERTAHEREVKSKLDGAARNQRGSRDVGKGRIYPSEDSGGL